MTRELPPKKLILILGDLTVSAAALTLALLVRYGGAPDAVVIELYRFAAPFLMALWLAGFAMFGLYDLRLAKNNPLFFERVIRAIVANFTVTAILFYLIPEFGLRPLGTLFIIFIAFTALLLSWRAGYNAVLARRFKERVLFLGTSAEVIELARLLQENPQLGFIPSGSLKIGNEPEGASPNLLEPPGPAFTLSKTLPAVIESEKIDRIVLAHDIKRTRAIVQALFQLVPLGLTFTDFPRFYEAVTGKVPVSLISEAWFFENLIGSRRPRYEFLKRILDLLLACLLGALALLLSPFTSAAIILSTPRDILSYKTRRARHGDGIIFFRQKRVGRNGILFDLTKFRSQVLGAEKLGWEKGTGRDPRAYPVGEFLRKTYLDELPQLWNIVKGEMSFVGPRPERPEFVGELEKKISFYRMRELVLPGITGWAQINMADDASVRDAPEKIQYDLYYLKNRSIFLDLTIMLKTVLKLLQRSGR